MNVITFTAFKEELAKLSSVGHAAVDIAGLGILARPTVQKMRGKEVSQRSEHAHELAGLGTLAAGVAHEHRHEFADAAKKGFGAIKRGVGSVMKRASVVESALSIFKTSAVPMAGTFRNAAADVSSMARRGLQGAGKAPGMIQNASKAVPRSIPSASQVGGHRWAGPATSGKYAPIAI